MPLTYLTPAAARAKLIAVGAYTEDDAPTEAALEFLLEEIEDRIDDWVGFRLAPTDYEETVKTSANGVALLRFYPVIQVSGVVLFEDHQVGVDALPTATHTIPAVWRQLSSIDLGYKQVSLGFSFASAIVRIAYRAGYDPLPPVVGRTVFTILQRSLQTSGVTGDLTFLDEPVRDVSSLSIPGGLSKSFQIGGGGGGGGGGSTVMDRLMKPLGDYRRQFTL